MTTKVMSARETLENAQHRIGALERQIAGINDRLWTYDHADVVALMDSRRAAEDERSWLRNKLDEYQSDANAASWAASRAELNEKWQPLAVRRIEATRELGVRTEELVSAIEALIAIHDEQKALLAAYTPMDKIAPRNADRVQRQLQILEAGDQQTRMWVARLLRPFLPTNARFEPQTLAIDEGVLAFRGHVL